MPCKDGVHVREIGSKVCLDCGETESPIRTWNCGECGELVSSTEGHPKKISPLSYEALQVYAKVNCSLCGSFVSRATVIAGGVQKWGFHKTTGKFICPSCSHELI